MSETIKICGIVNAEMQHEINAIESERKWHEICKKLRSEGRMP